MRPYTSDFREWIVEVRFEKYCEKYLRGSSTKEG